MSVQRTLDDERQTELEEFQPTPDDPPVRYRGPVCCRECRACLDSARRILVHLAEDHPAEVDTRLAELARTHDVERVVAISADEEGKIGGRRAYLQGDEEAPIKPQTSDIQS